MPNYTTNYNLKKPLDSELFTVDDANGNMDIIDTALLSKVDKTTTVNTKLLSSNITINAVDIPNTPSGNISSTTVQGAINELDNEKATKTEINKVILDVTIDAVWRVGPLTYDSATQTFTYVNHGYINGFPVEFDAGTGVLPSGILPYNSDELGGMYYNIINATANTFQITSTVGGTVPVSTTNNGTTGFKIRSAAVDITTSIITGLNLDQDIEYDVYIYLAFCKFATLGSTLFFRLNGVSTMKYFDSNNTTFGSSVMVITPTVTSKYANSYLKINIRKLDTNKVLINSSLNGQQSADKITATSLIKDVGAFVISNSNITSILIGSMDANILRGRSGTRVVIVKRGTIA